ncbi:MAG: efflux RND transporter periplasmic adaptor subunit [Chitinophagaceae bacterium]|nr:efflux RND transporter periplasmic adaptor subunit [Chitinophagaceae bacterium]MBK7123212.1 efflux RND transporter periplasmic adaptor subunit [Chitinophagaceae bacterium]MBK9532456.1 efflux RND transporter periplasmic adaptor subunit [Chitinophagaceae bacterium]HQW92063.1 efflux RND transporter periplasmic adaptor subunit [Ferruginibacter sp.]
MNNRSIIILAFFVAAGFYISCGGNESAEPAVPVTETPKEEHENPDEATLTAEQLKTIGIEFGKIEQKQLTASLKTNGVLKVPNQNKAGINSVYSGIIRSLLVQPGNIVSKGQMIASIANPEFIQVQGDYLGINSRIVLAEQEYSRQKELNAGNAGALKNLQAAEAELKALRTRRSSLQQQIQLMGINPASLSNGKLVSVLSVRSPISGVVSNVHVKMGSYVDVTTVIAEVVDNSQLHLDLFVYEKDLPKLKNKQTIHFTVTNNPGKEYDAEIFSLGSSFENESKAVSVHAMVKGDKTGLIDGMNITANISLDKATLPAIPTEAIINFQGQDYIFIVDRVDTKTNTTHFRRIPVVKGTSDVGYSEITLLKEIPAGAKVVTKGSFFILAKQTNTEGHND